MNKPNPIDRLEAMLTEAGIPFKRLKEKYPEEIQDDFKPIFGERAVWLRNQIIYGEDIEAGWWRLSAIWHAGSYGGPDELECLGAMIPDPTALSPEEIFERIKKHYEEHR